MLAGDDHARPTACARKWQLVFDEAIPAIELRSKTALLLSVFTGGLEEHGGRLIGHIKGLVDAGEKGHLLFSVTSFEEGARFKGELDGGITDAVLTINVIVYGLEEEIVETALEEVVARQFDGNRCSDGGGRGDAR